MKTFFQNDHSLRNIDIALLFFLEMGFVSFFRESFGIYLNPICMLIASILMAIILLTIPPKTASSEQNSLNKFSLFKNIFVGIIGVALLYEEVRKMFVLYDCADLTKSDVIPQILVMVNRLLNGEFPYKPIVFSYELISPYMPLHWMPFAIPAVLGIDLRWIEGIFFLLATIPYSYWIAKKQMPRIKRVFLLLAPTLPIWTFILFEYYDFVFTVEWLIAAYYLVLAVSVLSKSTIFRTIGLILTLLSRYSILFWVPFYILSIFLFEDKKKAILISAITGAAILLLYVVPFMSQDPQLPYKGLYHHQRASNAAWERVNEKGEIRILHNGTGLGNLFNVKGLSTEQKIRSLQITQLSLIFSFLVGAFFYYRKKKNEIPLPRFLLATLKVYLVIFIIFNQLPYIYYFLPSLMISVVVFSEVWGSEQT